jgi:hypothetical protein
MAKSLVELRFLSTCREALHQIGDDPGSLGALMARHMNACGFQGAVQYVPSLG